MPRPCLTCGHPQRTAIDQKLRSGVPANVLAEWTRSTDGGFVSRIALGRHRHHIGLVVKTGPRPVSSDFLRNVVDAANSDLATGATRPSIRDGIAAQGLLDRRAEHSTDRELSMQIALVLSGAWVPAIEGEYRSVEVPPPVTLEEVRAFNNKYLPGGSLAAGLDDEEVER